MQLICPCCGQLYEIDIEIKENRRFFCSRCQRKWVFRQGRPIPFGLELPRREGERQLLCPHCSALFNLAEQDTGEYNCSVCGKLFFVTAADGVPPSMPPKEDAVTPAAAVSAPESADEEDAAEPAEVSIPESADEEDAAEPAAAGSGNPLLAFGEDRPEFSTGSLAPGKLKVGLPRGRSGVSGIFIGIAEKLCGN